MSKLSTRLITQSLVNHIERLVVLREYYDTIKDPHVKSAINFTIDDTQEAIARLSSRLRQVGTISTAQLSEETTEKLLRQSRSRRLLGDKIRFIHTGLVHQLNWYLNQSKSLQEDADTQAILVGLAEQTRLRLERWENLMAEMKVSAE